MSTKCLACTGQFVQASKQAVNGSVPVLPEIKEAVTWAPAWQNTIIQGQMVISCVAVPTCMEHLGVEKESAAEIAARRGLALGQG